MKEIRVSIIIPLFNSINFIAETLDSVIKQSHTNIEVIIIDDGSTDGSFDYVKSIKKDDFILKRNKGKGACAARNYGFELSTGDYIQYLDADDLLNPQKIEEQLKLAEVYGTETVYSCSWVHFKNTIIDVDITRQPIDKDYQKPYQWLNDSWLGKGMGQTSIWLTPRKIIEKSGGWVESLKINQDGEFFSRVLLASKQIKYSDKALVYYRKGNANSVSQSNTYSKDKASSLLLSYRLYQKSAEKYNVLEHLKEGLGTNYLTFIYQFFNHFPVLEKEAIDTFNTLGYRKMWPVGGTQFKKIASVFGFRNALWLKKVLRFK